MESDLQQFCSDDDYDNDDCNEGDGKKTHYHSIFLVLFVD